jgi:hypothetical protein
LKLETEAGMVEVMVSSPVTGSSPATPSRLIPPAAWPRAASRRRGRAAAVAKWAPGEGGGRARRFWGGQGGCGSRVAHGGDCGVGRAACRGAVSAGFRLGFRPPQAGFFCLLRRLQAAARWFGHARGGPPGHHPPARNAPRPRFLPSSANLQA